MPTSTAAVEREDAVSDREDQIRRGVDFANSNALRMALYQHTRDPELAAMALDSKPIRGGALQMKVVAAQDLPLLKDKTVALLRDGIPPTPPPPTREETREMLRIFAGNVDVSEANLEFATEELAFEEFPRDVHWTNKPAPELLDKINVLVVGGGISGIATAIQLKRLGLNYTVVERQDDIGGTWQLNNYPGARVDTSSYAYQFKFEKNYRWSEYFAARDETRKYLQFIATKHDVLKNFRFRQEVTAATWHEDDALWEVELTDRDGTVTRERANFIITGSGLFATPNIPDIPGIETFEGRMFHTTQWDQDYDYAGKRVAQIGTGSTGVQLMTSLAERAEHVTVFQRSPNWITGVDGYRSPVPDEVQFLFDNLPYYWNWFCYSGFDTALQLQTAQTYDPAWRAKHGGVSESNAKLRDNLTNYIQTKLAGRPDLIEKVMPDHAPLGRRLVVDNGFYDALLRPNVDLVTCGIERITPKGILDKDGVEREYDLIVLSAGFKVAKYLFPIDLKGRDGATLESAWAKDGARSYLGLAMPGFPNLYMLYGPQGQPRSGGFYSWAEVWARYAGEMIVNTLESGHRSAEVKQPVFEEYNERLDEAGTDILWEAEGRGSYFNNEFGRSQVNIPFRTEEYHAMVRVANPDDYELR